jgi:hypothetical protein
MSLAQLGQPEGNPFAWKDSTMLQRILICATLIVVAGVSAVQADDCQSCRPPAFRFGHGGGFLQSASRRGEFWNCLRAPEEPRGPQTGQYAYPYYTTRGPRDFLLNNPPSIGPY